MGAALAPSITTVHNGSHGCVALDHNNATLDHINATQDPSLAINPATNYMK